MNSKLPLHGPGTYLFTFRGARKNPVFQSVFELDAGVRALAALPHTRLIAWLLEPARIRCVLRCEQDWPLVVEALQQTLSEAYQHTWKHNHQVLSEQVDVVAIDEAGFLMDTVLQLHRTPVYEGLVPTPELYPWSSDASYRLAEPPSWLDVESVLNRLAHSRHRREQHYIHVMEQLPPPHLDLVNGNQPNWLALARSRWMERHQPSTSAEHSLEMPPEHIEQAWHQACNLIATRFGCQPSDFLDPENRRLFHRLQPLAVWLLNQQGIDLKSLETITRQDQHELKHGISRVRADHPARLCDSLLAQFRQQWPPADAVTDAVQENAAEIVQLPRDRSIGG